MHILCLVDEVNRDAVVVEWSVLNAVIGPARLQVEGDGVCGGECLDGADAGGPPVVFYRVTIASHLCARLPDAHVHGVASIAEPSDNVSFSSQ